ncbi:MAG: hypothetical protein ACREDM_06425 [Methylocella sp.]
MILEYDESLENIVRTFTPKWTELRARRSDFAKLDENTFKSLSFMLVGEPSLLCFTRSKDLVRPRIEYFPLSLKKVDSDAYSFEQVTLARSGGHSEFEQKVQWLFNYPSMRLLEHDEEFADRIGPEAQKYTLRFYGGLELTSPKGRSSLRITASDMPDLVSYAKFVF